MVTEGRNKQNLYGLKGARRTCHEHLMDGLMTMGFSATESDPCILTRGSDISILYANDCVILSKMKREAGTIFDELER